MLRASFFARLLLTMMQVVQKINELVSGMPEQRILLSTLGLLLQQQLPDFSPDQYGHRTLKDFLRALPGNGALTRGKHPGQWWLTLRGPGTSDEAPPATSPGKLLPHVWKSVIDFDPTIQIWFDLESERLAEDDAAVTRDPDRYLALPRFPLNRQMELARSWCADQGEEHRPSLLASLDGISLDGFLEAITRLKLRADWNHYRAQVIAEEVRVWAQRHGITLNILFGAERSRPKRTTQVRAPLPSVTPMSLAEYRQFLHRMVDEMTTEELLQISVPGRFLVGATGA